MRPEFLKEMSWRMAEVYGAVTDRILVNLAKYFPFIQDADEVKGAFRYQAQMLAQMGQVRKETIEIIAQSLDGGGEALKMSLEIAIQDALKTEEPKLQKAAKDGMLGIIQAPEMSANQMQAFRAYYQQSADRLNLVNTVMLESTLTAYTETVTDITARISRTQGILNAAAGEVISGVSSWNTAVHDAVKKMVENGLTGFIDHGGHHWSPEAYAEMDIRSTLFNASREAVWERMEQYGNDLFQVSSHLGARPLCYPWQCTVISREDRARDVEDLYGNKIHVWALSETSYGEPAGLFGINCGHYPIVFIPGVSTITGTVQEKSENDKAYELSQQQRALERAMRNEKRDLAILKIQGADEDAIKAQKQRVQRASNKIRDFCEETGRTRQRNREYTPNVSAWDVLQEERMED